MSTTTFENKPIAYYVQEGESIPLIFVHGFCAESSVWDEFITLFPGRYIVRIDLPGFGNSAQIENYSVARFAEVIHAVLKNLDISECIFIGHSLGGYVGLEFAKKFGSQLKGLCLFHSHPYADTADKKTNRQKSIGFIQKNGPIYYVKQLIPALFASQYANNNHLQLAKLVYTASKYSAKNIIAGLEVMTDRVGNTKVLEEISCPALFIIGKEDTVVPEYVKETALPAISSIHLLKGVGHMGMIETSRKCERIIKDFIELIEISSK